MNVEYDYTTPKDAVLSLEKAYSKCDLNGIMAAKDFSYEAELVLLQAGKKINQELINETAELLKLSLIKHIQDNGFPSFENSTKEFTEVEKIRKDLFQLEESILYENGEKYVNKIYLSLKEGFWKVVMTVELE